MDSAALLSRVDELPRLPKAISELLDVVNDDNATVKNIATKVLRWSPRSRHRNVP